jgi:hypothetical protein
MQECEPSRFDREDGITVDHNVSLALGLVLLANRDDCA